MGSWIPRLALRPDGVTIHPIWMQKALKASPGTTPTPSAAARSLPDTPPDPRAAVAARVLQWQEIIRGEANAAFVPVELMYALIHQESGGDVDAYRVEPKVADLSIGLCQLLVGTARGLGYRGNLQGLFDIPTNIRLGCAYLRLMFDRFGSWEYALVGYNGGPGAVAWYKRSLLFPAASRYVKAVLALEAYYLSRETGS